MYIYTQVGIHNTAHNFDELIYRKVHKITEGTKTNNDI